MASFWQRLFGGGATPTSPASVLAALAMLGTDMHSHLLPGLDDGAETVAHSLEMALDALSADRDFLKAGGVFSDGLIDAYIELKRQDVQRLNQTTHPVEFEMYYSV